MSLPYVTGDLPGIGGRLREEPEDFLVSELPAYEPAGEGEHRFLELTKRGDSTPYVVGRLARALGLDPGEIGYAGLKDRQAVTTQRLSVPAKVSLDGLEGFEIRDLGLHGNKLRRGHLLGNRFLIRVREVHPEGLARAQAIAARLSREGWPNFYGPQRFGRENLEQARALLAGRGGRLPSWKRSLMVSSLQAQLFNRCLEERLARGDFARILPGDLCARLPAGGMFVGSPEAEQPRLDSFEISPTGPIYGFKMRWPEGEAREREEALLAEAGLELESFRRVKAPGSRRRLRLPAPELQLAQEGQDLVFAFELPAGSYATVFLGEFLKLDGLSEEPQEDA